MGRSHWVGFSSCVGWFRHLCYLHILHMFQMSPAPWVRDLTLILFFFKFLMKRLPTQDLSPMSPLFMHPPIFIRSQPPGKLHHLGSFFRGVHANKMEWRSPGQQAAVLNSSTDCSSPFRYHEMDIESGCLTNIQRCPAIHHLMYNVQVQFSCTLPPMISIFLPRNLHSHHSFNKCQKRYKIYFISNIFPFSYSSTKLW